MQRGAVGESETNRGQVQTRVLACFFTFSVESSCLFHCCFGVLFLECVTSAVAHLPCSLCTDGLPVLLYFSFMYTFKFYLSQC